MNVYKHISLAILIYCFSSLSLMAMGDFSHPDEYVHDDDGKLVQLSLDDANDDGDETSLDELARAADDEVRALGMLYMQGAHRRRAVQQVGRRAPDGRPLGSFATCTPTPTPKRKKIHGTNGSHASARTSDDAPLPLADAHARVQSPQNAWWHSPLIGDIGAILTVAVAWWWIAKQW